jgi:hypothetical protein
MHQAVPVRGGRVEDAVHHRVAQVDVARRHVDFGAQSRASPSANSPGAHAAEQVEVLLDAAVAVRAVFARLGERAAVVAHLLGAQVAT